MLYSTVGRIGCLLKVVQSQELTSVSSPWRRVLLSVNMKNSLLGDDHIYSLLVMYNICGVIM